MTPEEINRQMKEKKAHKSKNFLKGRNTTNKENTILTIKLKDIILDEEQVRKVFEEGALKELGGSITAQGQQTPIQVTPIGEEKYLLRMGERRYHSIDKYTEFDTIKAIYYTGDEKDKTLQQFVENEQRLGLNPIEIAHSLAKIKADYGISTNKELSDKANKNETYVSKHLKLLELPKTIVDDYYNNKRTFGVSILYTIATLETEEDMIKAYDRYINNDITRDNIVSSKKAPVKTSVMEKATKSIIKSFNISTSDKEDFQAEFKVLLEKFGAKIK
jgi:ParB/RepB/Spo0J family partition protein